MHLALHQKSESKSRNRVSARARAKLEVSNDIYALFILKQNNVRYGVIYYFSAVSFNYVLGIRDPSILCRNMTVIMFKSKYNCTHPNTMLVYVPQTVPDTVTVYTHDI